MAKRARVVAATVVAAVFGVGLGVASDPYLLVRAQFERQRLGAGLAQEELTVAGHRWVYAVADGPTPASQPIRPIWRWRLRRGGSGSMLPAASRSGATGQQSEVLEVAVSEPSRPCAKRCVSYQ